MEHFLVDNDLEKCANYVTKSCSKKIVVLGRHPNERRYILEYYNIETGNWSQIIEVPFEISYPTSIGVGDKVYVFGSDEKDNPIRAYDFSMDEWSEVGHMTKPRLVAELDGFVYIFGRYSNTAEKYDLGTKLSTNIAKIPFTEGINGVAVLNNNIYVVGYQWLGCYDTNTDRWTTTSITEARRTYAAVCALNGKLYIAGGREQELGFLNTVRVYDPEQHIWTYAKPMKVVRREAQAVVVDDKMYVVGGRDKSGSYLKSAEVYDGNTDSWTLLPGMNGERVIGSVAVTNIQDVRK